MNGAKVALMLSCGLLGLFVAGIANISHAQEAEISLGVVWLESDQDSSGLWNPGGKAPYRDSTTALMVLLTADADSVVIENGFSASIGFHNTSVDYLSRVLILQAQIYDSEVADAYAANLAALQSSNGGWGFAADYASNILDTSLALRALKSTRYTDADVLGQGTTWLKDAQNPDGGWSFVFGDASSTFFTVQVMLALAELQGDYDVSSELASAVTWLESQVQPDGGFGDGASNAYETGLALAALIKSAPSSPAIAGAQAWLATNQLPDGSWNSDAYSTALAIYGLLYVGPDLSVGSADIALSNPTPSDDEIVTISTTVHNRGVQPAENVWVQVFDGDPDQYGVQIGSDVLIASLTAGADSTIQVSWNTFELAGDHQIHAVVDPGGLVSEPDKSNNTGIKPVHVYFPPDLLINVSDIQFTPETPETTDNVTITTTVRNDGELPANSVTLQIYDGDPDTGGTPLLGPYIFSEPIQPGGTTALNLNMGNYFNTEGGHLITAVADVTEAIREISETNNRTEKTLWVGVRCEPFAVAGDLNLMGLPITPSDPVTSYSAMANIDNSLELHGWDPLTQSWQTAFDMGGGSLLGEDFDIGVMQGFFARTSAPGEAAFCGTFTTDHGCVDLEPGLNLVSVSHPSACYSGYHFLDSITDCQEAHAWNATTQSWVTAFDAGGGVPGGVDFTVGPGAGYFVKVGSGSNWCTVDCDTIQALPDLILTQDSIYCEPNPSPSGSNVNLFISVGNAGTVETSNPRIELAFGDPDGSGYFIGYFIMPEVLPPGSASPFYYVTLPVSGSGSLDIYAVVDHLGELTELDETNNKAYTTLYFSAAIDEDSVPQPVNGNTGPTTLIGTARMRQSSQQGPPPPLPVSTASSTILVPGFSAANADQKVAKAVTAIENILAANASSSAGSIFWTTNECADGRIDYGLTTSLDGSTSEEGICNDVHAVTLTGLAPETIYFYQIVSGGLIDDNSGAFYSFTTTASGVSSPAVITGQVLENETSLPMNEVLTWATLEHEGNMSWPLAVKTDAAGNWVLNLGNFKSSTTGATLSWTADDPLTVQFAKPGFHFEDLVTTLSGVSPQDLGTVYGTTGASAIGDVIPLRPYLRANFPNPFNPSTTIQFGMTNPGQVELAVFDITGRRVATLVKDSYPAGRHQVVWKGLDQAGRQVASGLYFYRLRSPEFSETKKMLLLK